MNSCILSICIVSYNTSELTLDAVRSAAQDIQRSNFLKKRSEIIIVDNNSKDDTVSVLQHYKEYVSTPIQILQNSYNPGFAKANNQAIQCSTGKYVLLLNSDTYVQPGALEKMVLAFEEVKDQSSADLSSYGDILDRIGILSATLIFPDGSFQPQGGSLPSLFSLKTHMLLLDDLPLIGKFLPSTQQKHRYPIHIDGQPAELIKRDWVAGTAMMLRREMLDEIGLLDEKIFMYAEDMELCVRAKHHHWDVAIHPTAFITHIKTASSSSSTALEGEFKGYLYIWAKHKPIWQYHFAKLIMQFGIVLRVLLFGTMGRSEKARQYKKILKTL